MLGKNEKIVRRICHLRQGFSLVESLVAIAIFVMLAGVIYQTSALLIKGIGTYRENTAISSLADQYMEIVHNLPYSAVGTLSGNPHGSLPDLPNAPQVTVNDVIYQIYYVVNYIDDPADGTAEAGTDPAPNDYKQVKLYIKNSSTSQTYSFATNITPKNLESLESGGALAITVFDAVGKPVPNATVNIVNNVVSPNINLTRTTDASGNWIEVGLPDSANSYHITATKNGYSSDGTSPITDNNPNPTKTNSTILNGQVTKISFSIDKLSTLSFETLDQSCNILTEVPLKVQGEKLIGEPDLLKFDHNYTSDSAGKINLGSIEWDNYRPTLTGGAQMVYGSSPVQEVSVLPDTNQNFALIIGPKTIYGLLTIVKDVATGNPVEGADVQLQNTTLNIDETKITGGSVWSNPDWTGGPGQTDWLDNTKYFGDDGNISTNVVPTALRLWSNDNGATYAADGSLISSTFDTGTASTTYTTLTWQPTSQDPATTVKFQIAVNNQETATTTWNFTGPEGSGSFYTTSGTTINAPEARYIRYKVYLNTTETTKTPTLTNVNINYISGCFTPGQVFFSGISSSSQYMITVNANGYQTKTIDPLTVTGYQTLNVSLNH